MTREEAADLLENLIGMVEDNQENDYDTALKMAIEELKRTEKHTETHGVCLDDLIKRTYAIDAAIEAADEWDGGYNLTRSALIENAIKALPSAQQKPLKYSGDSICIYCMTRDCSGCVYEPMEGVMNE